jgi:hypothetical protein
MGARPAAAPIAAAPPHAAPLPSPAAVPEAPANAPAPEAAAPAADADTPQAPAAQTGSTAMPRNVRPARKAKPEAASGSEDLIAPDYAR